LGSGSGSAEAGGELFSGPMACNNMQKRCMEDKKDKTSTKSKTNRKKCGARNESTYVCLTRWHLRRKQLSRHKTCLVQRSQTTTRKRAKEEEVREGRGEQILTGRFRGCRRHRSQNKLLLRRRRQYGLRPGTHAQTHKSTMSQQKKQRQRIEKDEM